MQRRIIIRNVLKVIGIFGVILFIFGSPGNYYLLIGSAAAFFLGLTDFGRQCPLFLSIRHIIYRIKSRK